MQRVIPNLIEDTGYIAALPEIAQARYGADLLGRAIGHEWRHEASRGADATMFYSNLVHQVIENRTHRIMAFQAAREV